MAWVNALTTLARKPESKNFDAQASVIHHQKRIASGFPGVCDFKSVCGAPGEIFHFEGFQILKLCLFLKVFKIASPENQSLMTMLVE